MARGRDHEAPLLSWAFCFLSELKVVISEVGEPFGSEVFAEELFIFPHELLDFLRAQQTVVESALVALVTLSSGVKPLAWKKLRLVRKFALSFRPRAIV